MQVALKEDNLPETVKVGIKVDGASVDLKFGG